MLLTGYTKEIFRPECNASFQSVHCSARLNEDVGKVLPYLNAVLGGTQYFTDPPEVMFHHHGRIIKVGAREIAINALKDEEEADRVLEWLKTEINQAWDKRAEITPCYAGKKKPLLMEILKLLPRTNCKKCGQPTCMVFAAQVMEGGRGIEDCPDLTDENREVLAVYLSGFEFD
ncbi:MAG: (Fe-S)-binding protein [Desulfobacterales bacterium]